MLSFLSFCIWQRTGKLKKVAKARRKTACIRADTEKMPQKMTATCHTRPQARLHKHKTANINERQQEHKEPGAKILMNIVARTAGWRSTLSNGARQRKPTKTKQMQRPFFNKLRIKAKED